VPLSEDIKSLPPAVKYGVPIGVVVLYLWYRYRSGSSAASTAGTAATPSGSSSGTPTDTGLLDHALKVLQAQEQADINYLNKIAKSGGKPATGQHNVNGDHTGTKAPKPSHKGHGHPGTGTVVSGRTGGTLQGLQGTLGGVHVGTVMPGAGSGHVPKRPKPQPKPKINRYGGAGSGQYGPPVPKPAGIPGSNVPIVKSPTVSTYSPR
jgi:hypothetical protein